jgi:type 1 glutamine amidotransferase
MRTAAVLVGGWAHPAEQTGPAIGSMLSSLGIEPTLVDHPDGLPAAMSDQDLLVIHGCFFRMLDARYTPEQRAEFAYTTTADVRRSIADWVGAGRPVLAMHTAVLCFDDWDEWPEIAGAGWDWAKSHHPPMSELQVSLGDDARTAGLNDFAVVDERYSDLDLLPGSQVLATATSDGVGQPAVWVHHAGSAPVVYDALGHDERSLGDPDHRALVGRLLDHLA